ncbi:MAG: PilZ domain-containing protein [Planctomycetes bacterium]|nr:PilZ domain-containing protein [Planctomycetota bacterium]
MVSHEDKRRFPRVPMPAESAKVSVTLQAITGATIDQTVVHVHDLSRVGMSFHRTHGVPAGTRCVVVVSQKGKALRIVGKVVRCLPVEGKGYLLGVSFTNIQQLSEVPPAAPLATDGVVDRLMVDV